MVVVQINFLDLIRFGEMCLKAIKLDPSMS